MPNLGPLKAIAKVKAGDVPDDAVAFHAVNASAITSTTPVEIKAATALKAIYVTKLIIQNATIAEAPIIHIQDDSGTPVVYARVSVSTAAGNAGWAVMEFDPPLKVTTGQALDGRSDASTGDTFVHAMGYVGTPA